MSLDSIYDIPLSQRDIKKTARRLRKLAKELKSDNTLQPIRNALAQRLLERLNHYIATIDDPDGNSIGVADIKNVWERSYVRWIGDQVIFLEYGTGHYGALSGYIGVYAAGYKPEDHYWWYGGRLTGGIPAYAPMYNVYLDAEKIAKSGDFRNDVEAIIKLTIQEVFNA